MEQPLWKTVSFSKVTIWPSNSIVVVQSLVCFSPWGRKELDMTERLNWTLIWLFRVSVVAHGIFNCSMWHLVPGSGIKPGPSAFGAWSLSHWTTREVPGTSFWSYKNVPKPDTGDDYATLWIHKKSLGTSLMVQWLRLHTPNAGGQGSTPGQGTRSHRPQLRSSAVK